MKVRQRYIIDWAKVKTVQDIGRLMKAMKIIWVLPLDFNPKNSGIKDLVRKDNQ